MELTEKFRRYFDLQIRNKRCNPVSQVKKSKATRRFVQPLEDLILRKHLLALQNHQACSKILDDRYQGDLDYVQFPQTWTLDQVQWYLKVVHEV